MKPFALISLSCLILVGCAGVMDRIGISMPGPGKPDAVANDAPLDPFVPSDPVSQGNILTPETSAPPPAPSAQSAEALDTTTAEQRAAAVAPPAAPTRDLGRTVASLGSPTEPGLWLKTPLVKAEAQGRVTNPANGKSSLVTLIPLDGPATGGSRVSLSAMRLIGASLTDLTEVTVALEG
ncbi:hypothetical protein [Sulfitobacter sp. M368]|uniref:hypothetical protein n=1 Tax=Sulfitobacter sp. M368 TaxID=2867021 RepID=UPI0021A96A68|nr:hypothetical protein [Sulfitobacter sp. M368]UWR16776.1 hypothetical protein K3754_07830 [Sulfitobacter sp. M368]